MEFQKEKLILKQLGQWPDAKYKRLFDLYKARPFLWNKNAPNYMNHWKTKQALDEIGSELGCCSQEAKMRFRSMKQTYQKHVKNMAQDGEAGNTEIQWRFAESLSFLSTKSERCDSVNNMVRHKQAENIIGADDAERKWHNVTNFPFVSSETPQSELADTIYQDFYNENLMDFEHEGEGSEPECIEEGRYSEKRQATDLATTNRSSGVYKAFANTITKQLEGFPEDVSYQLMADIQTLLSQRKVASIRETQGTNDEMCLISKKNESTVANSFIKQETVT